MKILKHGIQYGDLKYKAICDVCRCEFEVEGKELWDMYVRGFQYNETPKVVVFKCPEDTCLNMFSIPTDRPLIMYRDDGTRTIHNVSIRNLNYKK